MDNTLIIAFIAAVVAAMPGIIGLILLRGRVATNAKQVTIDIQATEVARDKIVTDFAAEAFKLNDLLHAEKDRSRVMNDRIVFLEKREVERETNDKKRDAEQVLRETEYNTKLTGLNTTLEAAYTEIKNLGDILKTQGASLEGQRDLLITQGELLDRAYKQVVLQSDQIKTLVTEISKLTGQPEEQPPVGDKGIQAAAQAAVDDAPLVSSASGTQATVTLPKQELKVEVSGLPPAAPPLDLAS